MTPTNLEADQNGRHTTRRSGKPPKPADRNDRGEVSSVVASAWPDGVANRPIGKAVRGRAAAVRGSRPRRGPSVGSNGALTPAPRAQAQALLLQSRRTRATGGGAWRRLTVSRSRSHAR